MFANLSCGFKITSVCPSSRARHTQCSLVSFVHWGSNCHSSACMLVSLPRALIHSFFFVCFFLNRDLSTRVGVRSKKRGVNIKPAGASPWRCSCISEHLTNKNHYTGVFLSFRGSLVSQFWLISESSGPFFKNTNVKRPTSILPHQKPQGWGPGIWTLPNSKFPVVQGDGGGEDWARCLYKVLEPFQKVL